MKCIVSDCGEKVERVKDDVAKKKVESGKWKYTDKQTWKQRVRDKNNK